MAGCEAGDVWVALVKTSYAECFWGKKEHVSFHVIFFNGGFILVMDYVRM